MSNRVSLAVDLEPDSNPGGDTVLDLSISCQNLTDSNGKPVNAMCAVYIKEFLSNHCNEVGQTETINVVSNPEFNKKITVNYVFEQRQYLRFKVYNVSRVSYDLLGRLECTLGEVVSEVNFEKPIEGLENATIRVTATETSTSKEEVTLEFSAKNLDKKDLFGKSDPFLLFYHANEEDDKFEPVHQTEILKNTCNPHWHPIVVKTSLLCSHHDQVMLIRCFDWNRNGEKTLIGEVITNMNVIMSHSKGCAWNLTKYKPKVNKTKITGKLVLRSCNVRPFHTFIDYIQKGTHLSCAIAIDFTLSNGPPTSASSYHYLNPDIPNQYHRALGSVGEIIQDYDNDKEFPVLGFGAKLPDGKGSDMFYVNMDPSNPMCSGISGVMQAYRKCLSTVQLFGPTNFAPCIKHIAQWARENEDGSEYFILLILTDGCVTDLNATKETIVNACSLPLSIIIIGIGKANFRSMDVLDGDTIRLSSRGRFAERDIVQFVPFGNFIKTDSQNETLLEIAQAQLAKEVLSEVPGQFLSYMASKGFIPGTAKHKNSQKTILRHKNGRVEPNDLYKEHEIWD